GQTYPITIKMRNSGTLPWQNAGVNKYGLGSQNPQDTPTWGGRVYIPSTATVVAGSTYTFRFNVVAPSTAGVYNFQWRMLQENVTWFGGTTLNVAINVQKSTAAASAVNLVAADLANCRVYPNPWRSDKH